MKALLFLLAGWLVTACAGLPAKPQSPEVRLVGLALGQASLQRQRIILELDVANPNRFQLPVKALEYQVGIAGKSFASGALMEKFMIPANASVAITLPVDTDFMTLLGVLVGRAEISVTLSQLPSIVNKARPAGNGKPFPRGATQYTVFGSWPFGSHYASTTLRCIFCQGNDHCLQNAS